MSTDDYAKRIEALGISRGQLAEGFEDRHSPGVSQEYELLNDRASMRVRTPAELLYDCTSLRDRLSVR
jgi:hypothetical protein